MAAGAGTQARIMAAPQTMKRLNVPVPLFTTLAAPQRNLS
jgi:hypothetical protein